MRGHDPDTRLDNNSSITASLPALFSEMYLPGVIAHILTEVSIHFLLTKSVKIDDSDKRQSLAD